MRFLLALLFAAIWIPGTLSVSLDFHSVLFLRRGVATQSDEKKGKVRSGAATPGSGPRADLRLWNYASLFKIIF